MAEKAVILLSGGLDSTTCLAMAKAQGFVCYTLGFDYGQRHNSELKAAVRVADGMSDNPHKVIRLNLDAIGGSALTDESIERAFKFQGMEKVVNFLNDNPELMDFLYDEIKEILL